MNRNQFEDKHRQANIQQAEIERKWRAYQEEQQSMEQMMFEAVRAASSAAVASGAGGGSSVNPDSDQLTPFILQAWAVGETEDWGLYRLRTDGSKVLVENAPPLEGPTVFAKNTQNGLHYYITYNVTTELSNFGMWDSITGEWQFLMSGVEDIRPLVPASLQFIEGDDNNGSYFLYTDNSPYDFFIENDNISPLTFRIDLDTPVSFELTQLYVWDIPEEAGNFPISNFYQLPVDMEAIPPQSFYQVQQYMTGPSGIPYSYLSIINAEASERIYIDIMSIDDHTGYFGDGIKIAYVLDRTDYENSSYFNIMVRDKFSEDTTFYIAKFDSTSDHPANLKSVLRYNWDSSPYVTLTTI